MTNGMSLRFLCLSTNWRITAVIQKKKRTGCFRKTEMVGLIDLNLSPAVVKGELRDAYVKLSAHGLLHSAKWVAEQAAGVGRVKAIGHETVMDDDDQDEDAIMLGKSFFDVREYRFLSDCQ